MSSQPGQDSPQRIVVGVDGSEGSRSALWWAAAEAEAHSAELEVVMARVPALPLPSWDRLHPGADQYQTTRPGGSDAWTRRLLSGCCGRSSAVGSLPS
jgi:Universal stress protein family